MTFQVQTIITNWSLGSHFENLLAARALLSFPPEPDVGKWNLLVLASVLNLYAIEHGVGYLLLIGLLSAIFAIIPMCFFL